MSAANPRLFGRSAAVRVLVEAIGGGDFGIADAWCEEPPNQSLQQTGAAGRLSEVLWSLGRPGC